MLMFVDAGKRTLQVLFLRCLPVYSGKGVVRKENGIDTVV